MVDATTKKLLEANLPTESLIWSQNLFFGGDLLPTISALKEDPKLEFASGRFSLSKTSPAIDAGQGDFDFVTVDIDNQLRQKNKDIGADELNETATKIASPLTREQVGTTFLDRVIDERAEQ